MAKAPRKKPGIGHNGDFAEASAIRAALAMEILDQEEMAALREARKVHRKAAEGNRVNLAKLDYLYKHKDDTASEILDDVRSMMHHLGAVYQPLQNQFDMFVKASASPEMQHASFQAGMFAGLTGKPPTAPPALVGEDHQLWMKGHHEGSSARSVASKVKKEEKKRAEELAKAEAAEGAAALNGTGNGTKAENVRAQAAADFAKDNPDVQAPEEPKAEAPAGDGVFDGDGTLPDLTLGYADAGERYMLSSDETFASGRRACYQDGKPVGSSIPGKVRLFDKHPPAAGANDDGFEATEEELAAQKERKLIKERQQAETPDPEDVDAAARKLQESGFAPEKPKRTRRLPGERSGA